MENLNILFVGNSYTYYNDLPEMFEKLANENGKNVKVFSVTSGGRKLYENVRSHDEYSKQIDELIMNCKFDICIMQEQSILPITDYNLFADGVKELTEKLKPVVEQFVLYETWGRKDGSETLKENGWTNRGMTMALAEAYEKASKLVDVQVSHVGLNFYEIYKNHKEIDLYNADLTHPSYKGSCLAALTHYKTIFNEFPQNTETLSLSENEILAFKKVNTIKLGNEIRK